METLLDPAAATYSVNVSPDAQDTAVALSVMGNDWLLSIERVTRIAQELFIEIRLNGVEDCAATVHVHGRVVLGVTAREILERTCEWLLTRGSQRYGFIDVG